MLCSFMRQRSFLRVCEAPCTAMARLLALFLILSIGAVAAADQYNLGPDDDREVYVVYMGSKPNAAADVLFATQKTALMSVFESEFEASSSIIRRYKHAFNGFSARLTAEQAESLADVPGVVSVFKSRKLELHTTHSWEFLGFTVNDFRESWKRGDSDVIIGILDTGIWPESDSFRDHGMGPVPNRWKGSCENGNSSEPIECNRKVIGARAYYDGSVSPNGTTLEYTNARDSVGHGTHTASTVCGRVVPDASLYGLCKGNARGGLPRSRIAVYKVCFYGDCLDHWVLAAFDDAINDGVDLLSVSLGGPPLPFDKDSIAIGSFHAMKRGILVSCSAGNSGPFAFTVTNVAPWLLTVGSSSTNRRIISSVQLGNREIVEGSGINIKKMSQKKYGLVYGRDAAIEQSLKEHASSCVQGSLNQTKVKDQIVICATGRKLGSRIGNSSATLHSLGAAGVIQVNDLAAGIAFSYVLPFTIVDTAGGRKILSYINSTSRPTAVILPTEVRLEENSASSVSVFSARGPSRLGLEILKPDLLAPGANILAAWTPVKSPIRGVMDTREGPALFNIVSGTSMACPHAAGAAAYVKSFHTSWSPSMIKSALMTTARSKGLKDFNGDTVVPFDYGAGEMNPIAATDPGLVYDVSASEYMLYLCSMGYDARKIRVITGTSNVSCRDGFKPQDLNYPTVTILDFDGKHQTVDRTATNVGPSTSTYTVSVDAPKGVELTVVPTELRFSSEETTQRFAVHVSSDKPLKDEFVFGSFSWSDGHDGHSVTSTVLIIAPVKEE